MFARILCAALGDRIAGRGCRPGRRCSCSREGDRGTGSDPAVRPGDVREPLARADRGGIVSGLLRKKTYLRASEMKPRYDAVVIGGGVQGLATAYYLAARHDITDLAVIERAYIGSGGSGRNTQVIRANYNTPETIPFYKASLAMYETLSQDLDFNILFTQQGEL